MAGELSDSRNIFIGIGVDVSVMAAVSAVLDAVLVVMADGSGTGDVGTIQSIEAWVALAESIGTDTIVGTISRAVKDAKGPQIIHDERLVSHVETRPLRLLVVANAAIEQ